MVKISDVSEIIKGEQEKAQLMYQEAMMGTFSHEFMTPLNSIVNLTNMLKEILQENETCSKLLGLVQNSSKMLMIMN